MKPTKTEVREFWQKCGFTVYEKDGGMVWWNYPDGSYKGLRLPPIDLNTLFKFAVPKVNGLVDLIYEGGDYYVNIEVLGYKLISTEGKDPALALFWAIKKALDERDS